MERNSIQVAYYSAVKSDLNTFTEHAFRCLNPTTLFMPNWHIPAIIYELEMALEGKHRRLIINMPPRHLKSFTVSVSFPAFVLGHDPTAKIICVSYSDILAKEFSRQFRRVVTSPWYRRLFPGVVIVKDTESELVTSAGGRRITTSVGGSITGRGGDILISDDSMKPDECHSDAIRNKVNDWYRDVLQTRLDDPQTGVILIVMQRLHVNDLTGYLLDLNQFRLLSLPVIAPQDREVPIGPGQVYSWKEGELLHPARMGQAEVDALRTSLGPASFNAQYLQNPDIPEGELFKEKWVKYVDQIPMESGGRWILSVDTALTTSATSDYTAVTMLYSDPYGHYVRHVWRERWDYEEVLNLLRWINRRHPYTYWYVIEAAGMGHALVSALKNAGKYVFWTRPQVDKVARAHVILPLVAAGRLHLYVDADERNNEWIKPFVREWVSFPRCRHDDQVDSLIQALYFGERRENPRGDYLTGWLDGSFGGAS